MKTVVSKKFQAQEFAAQFNKAAAEAFAAEQKKGSAS